MASVVYISFATARRSLLAWTISRLLPWSLSESLNSLTIRSTRRVQSVPNCAVRHRFFRVLMASCSDECRLSVFASNTLSASSHFFNRILKIASCILHIAFNSYLLTHSTTVFPIAAIDLLSSSPVFTPCMRSVKSSCSLLTSAWTWRIPSPSTSKMTLTGVPFGHF